MSDWSITVVIGDDAGNAHRLVEGATIVGRHSSCDFRLVDEAVSRKHARIVRSGDAVTIEDLNSGSGVWIDDEQVALGLAQPLRHGAQVRLGRTLLKVVDGSQPSETSPASLDRLTGLMNKKTLLAHLDQEIAAGAQLSIAMIDLDHFKAINGFAGHQVGDEILKHVAGVIDELVPRDEVVARYGGEEFVVVLPDTTAEGALRFGSRLCEVLASQPFRADGEELVINVSVGAAAISTRSTQVLLMAAEDALWRAKKAGRNRASL